MSARHILSSAAILYAGLLAGKAPGPRLTGSFSGALSRDGSVQLITMHFESNDTRLAGAYDIPELGIHDVAFDTIAYRNDSLFFTFYYGAFACTYFPATEEIAGVSVGWIPKIRLHVKRIAGKEKPYVPKDLVFSNGPVRLSGTLFQPRTSVAFPVVILIHGSDAQDRTTWYYRSLGYRLAELGIGAFLYDKRGCGASGGSFEEATLQELAGDAVAAHDALRADRSLPIGHIGYLGSSQGGWIAPIAANSTDDCAFVILNMGPSVPMFAQDIHRVRYSMEGDGWEPLTVDSAVDYTERYFTYVRSGSAKDQRAVIAMAEGIRDRDWAEYVNLDLNEAELAWWRRNDYDPAATLRALHCPTLSIFGELDPLVPPRENQARMEELLGASGVEHRILVLPGCGHDGRTFQGLNGNDWDWPAVYWEWRKQPTVFMQSVADWISAH